MGKKKVELKRIENKSSRQGTFSKRRNCLIKKARELSILCDADVALLIFSSRGKLYQFSGAASLAKVLERYSDNLGASTCSDTKDSELANVWSCAELTQLVRSLDGSQLECLSVRDLVKLEKQLDGALSQVRSIKMQVMVDSLLSLQKEVDILTKENEYLEQQGIKNDKSCT